MDRLRPVWAVKAIVLIVITSIFFRCVWATNHSVSWDLTTNLHAWSTKTKFHAGDLLEFMYLPPHDVLEVNQIDYIMCRTMKPIKAYIHGESVIRLHQPGTRYFICGRLRHCFMGLKLQVRVLEQRLIDSNNSTDGDGDGDPEQGRRSNNTPSSPPAPPRPSTRSSSPPPPPPRSGSSDDPPEAPDISGQSPLPCCSAAGNLMKWGWVICITLVILTVSAWSPQELRLFLASLFSGSTSLIS